MIRMSGPRRESMQYSPDATVDVKEVFGEAMDIDDELRFIEQQKL